MRALLLAWVLGTTALGWAAPVTINGTLIGTPPPDLDRLVASLNAHLEADLHVRLELSYIGWNEVNTKYGLVLAGGDGVDWIFAADWAPYAPQAVRGAFRELTVDDLKRWMPRHWAATPPAAWAQAEVGGRVYMVPSATPDRKVPVAVIRGDLRKAAGLPPISSVADLEPYLAAVKARGTVTPMALGSGYDIGQPFMALVSPGVPPILASFFGTIYGQYESPQHQLVNLLDPEYRPAFVQAARTLKRWYDRGYLNRAPFANVVHSKDTFAAGRSAVGFGNSQDIAPVVAAAAAQGFDPEVIPILSSTGHSPADSWTGNGAAIAATSRHPDLALQVLDRLMEDPAYVGLLAGEGPDLAGFWFVNKGFVPKTDSSVRSYEDHRRRLADYLVPNQFQGFVYDPRGVKNAIASITTVMDQYWAPLAVGAVADVDKAVAALEAKLRSAGQPEALADLKGQLAAWKPNR